MKPLKWGVVSTARIGLEKVLPAMARSPDCEIVAIASRDRERAESAARKLGILKTHGTYEDLFADAEVEAVYNPLPNHLHVPVSIQAIEAGRLYPTGKFEPSDHFRRGPRPSDIKESGATGGC
jgi:predicted dehydrogenase